MLYFYDTEFIEDGKTIDLLSIAIVAEDGREFYAQNEECDFARASEWVKANVFPYLEAFDLATLQPHRDAENDTEGRWYTRRAIADELLVFCDPERYGKPQFWGYYADYDHVALCQLFGTMMDLPKGWPMITYDLRQLLDIAGYQEIPQPDHALMDARWIARTYRSLPDTR